MPVTIACPAGAAHPVSRPVPGRFSLPPLTSPAARDQTESFFVPLNKLDRDPKNVRKTYSKEGVAEMAATIRADGYRLLQNIIVRKGDKRGRFFVTAGERRRAALLFLADAGEISKDYPVECKERSEAEATEISIIENMQREAMHPVDEYEAYRVMAEDGKSVEDIAARFGTTETMVRKRQALGRVSPKLLELYRSEEMTFQQLTAFTVSDDHDRQVEVWNNLPSHNRTSDTIRDVLKGKAVKFNDKRIKFIGGIELYEAAGGPVKRDLFDTRNSGFALDAALVEKLVAEKLQAEAEAVRAEGWKLGGGGAGRSERSRPHAQGLSVRHSVDGGRTGRGGTAGSRV